MSPRVRLSGTILRKLEAEGRVPTGAVGVKPAASVVVRTARGGDDWPLVLAVQCRQAGLPAPVREHRFHPVRRWRLDLAWVDHRVGVEVDGGAFRRRPCPSCGAAVVMGGRHTSGPGFRDDCVKLGEAAALGYRIIRVMPEQVKSGEALGWVERALAWAPYAA